LNAQEDRSAVLPSFVGGNVALPIRRRASRSRGGLMLIDGGFLQGDRIGLAGDESSWSRTADRTQWTS